MSVFFFSSRRRHTRFKCDWSSDVCSSDLKLCEAYIGPVQHSVAREPWKNGRIHLKSAFFGRTATICDTLPTHGQKMLHNRWCPIRRQSGWDGQIEPGYPSQTRRTVVQHDANLAGVRLQHKS